jgi:hypothetical protein
MPMTVHSGKTIMVEWRSRATGASVPGEMAMPTIGNQPLDGRVINGRARGGRPAERRRRAYAQEEIRERLRSGRTES